MINKIFTQKSGLKSKLLLFLAAGMTFSSVNASFTSLTFHSRSNCLSINETIAWDWLQSHELSTHSGHYYNGKFIHFVHDWDRYTWRSAAWHMYEAYGGWYVWGDHWMNQDYEYKHITYTESTDCNIYDGWWDWDHPERKS